MNDTIPFDSLTLRAVTAELREKLIGGQIQDIRQPDRSEVQLGIRSHGKNHLLLLSMDTHYARVHLSSRRLANSSIPTTFCMSLRKNIEGSVIKDIRQRGFDRIFEIEVDARNGEDERVSRVLIAELMGKHSNIILVEAGGNILESAKRITHRINRFREVLPGLPYLPPPAQSDRLDPFDPETLEILIGNLEPEMGSKSLMELLSKRIAGCSPFLAQEFAVRTFENDEGAAEGLRAAWLKIIEAAKMNKYDPTVVIVDGKTTAAYPFPLVQFSSNSQSSVTELNDALDAAYLFQTTHSHFDAQLGELRGQIEKNRKRFTRQKEAAESSLQEASRAEQSKQGGELILANLWQIDSGAANITVQDYFSTKLEDTTLTLDPKLTPQENAEAYFKRYRKQRDGETTAIKRAADAERLLSALSTAGARLEELDSTRSTDNSLIEHIREELKKEGALPIGASDEEEALKPRQDFQGHKIKQITTPEGYQIYVGETATANDFLTTRIASPNDLWLHVRSSAGSHVVIRTKGHPELVPRQTLQRAAQLCAQHSSQKHSSLIPVDYTLKKFVRKPRGSAPGSVDYHHETTIHIEKEE